MTDPETARAAQLQLVAGLVRHEDYDKALQLCDAVIKESAKSQVLAEAWVRKGDTFLDQRQWDDAVLAYLHVPVFYADEKLWMPPALLGSARAFRGLGDLEGAKKILQRSDRRISKISAGGDRPSRIEEAAKMKKLIREISRLTKLKQPLACLLAAAGALLLLATPGPGARKLRPAAPPAGAQSKTLWQQIKEGGWVMFPIALCSIATLYLIGDGIIRTSRKKAAPPEQEESLKTLFRQGDYVGAHNYCKSESFSPDQCPAGRNRSARRGQTSRPRKA